LDLRAGELHGNGESMLLSAQVLQVLQILIEHERDIVTREEMKKRLWPNDTIVEFDFGINNTIKNLRRALGDSADHPSYIETIPRRGYRLMVPVEWIGAEPSAADSDEKSSAVSSRVEGPAVSAERAVEDPDSEALPKASLKVGRLTGKVISHYRVLEVIGGGGMGLVYRAEDLKLGRAVALKFLPEEVGDDPKARERFEREAHAVSALDHPNICTIYDFDEHEGHPFIAMQLLQGKTLRDHLADGRFRLTQPEGLEIAVQIASGLEAAHEKGIIHRDIKPANIFITEKNVAKILDFGVAKVMENPHPGKGGRDGAPAELSKAVILSEDAEQREGEESKDPYDKGKGRGFNEGAGLQPRRAAAPEEERGNQSHAGLIPAQSSHDGDDGAPEGAPLQTPGLKPEEEDYAQRRAEAQHYPKETTLTRTGMKLGTAGYMSPEQVRGEPLDARTDIFSFGLVLYEMATGQRAFTGKTEAIVNDAIQHRDPKPVRELAPEITPSLAEVIGRCLEKEPAQRFQRAAEVKSALADVKNQSAPAVPLKRRHTRTDAASRWRWLIVAVIATACAVGLLLYRRAKPNPLRAGATIVVADTVNATNDAVLNDALNLPLRTEFLQTPFFNSLGSDKIRETLKVLKQPEDSRLTPELTRQVCLHTNSDAVLQSSIKDAGTGYLIELAAVRCDTGAQIARAKVKADRRSQIIRMLGVAGAQLRAKLGEPDDSVKAYNAPLEEATSASLEALQAEVKGWRAYHHGADAAAWPYFKEAVELDPDFAVAQAAMGALYHNAGELADAADSDRTAFALRQRLTQRDRIKAEERYYSWVTGEADKAIAAHEHRIAIFPGDPSDHGNLAYLLRTIGQPERAAAEAHEAFRITPFYPSVYNLALSEMAMGRSENAKRALDEAQKLGLEDYQLTLARFLLAFWQGDRAAMQQQVAGARGKPGFELYLIYKEAETAAFTGQFRRARLLAAQAANLAQKEASSEISNRLMLEQAFREAEVGEVGYAQNTLRRIGPLGEGMYMSSLAAITMANSGDIAGAEKLTAHIAESYPLDTMAQKFWLPAASALIEMHRNAPVQAVHRLEVYSPFELAQPGVQNPFGNMYPTYVRGLAYLKANQGDNAAKEFQKIIDHGGLVLNFIIGALAHLQLARAYAMMGDKDAARKSYQDFLTLWKDADPDIPIYRQAKAEYKKLMAPSPSGAKR